MRLPISPMLAELAEAPTLGDDDLWKYPRLCNRDDMAYEFKWDGHRIIAVNTGTVELYARSGALVTHDYPEIATALTKMNLPVGTVVDGEAVALVNGKSNLQALAGRKRQTQTWRNENIRYMMFDVLADDMGDINKMEYAQRRIVLDGLLNAAPPSEVVQISPYVTDIGIMWPIVAQYELEGVIAKPLESQYLQGNRGIWSKLKLNHRSEFIVVGYTQGSGSRSDTIGALVLAEKIPFTSELRFSGKCGTGFNDTEARQLLAAMKPLEQATSQLGATQAAYAKAASPGNVTKWIGPLLVVTVEYAERSNDEIVRFPSYKGIVSYGPVTATAKAAATRTQARAAAALPAALPPVPPLPTGVKVGFNASGTVRQPHAGDVFQAPGSTGMRNVIVKGGDKGLYLACECPAGKFVWKGGSFSPCKHMKYVLATDLAGNTIVDGIFA